MRAIRRTRAPGPAPVQRRAWLEAALLRSRDRALSPAADRFFDSLRAPEQELAMHRHKFAVPAACRRGTSWCLHEPAVPAVAWEVEGLPADFARSTACLRRLPGSACRWP